MYTPGQTSTTSSQDLQVRFTEEEVLVTPPNELEEEREILSKKFIVSNLESLTNPARINPVAEITENIESTPFRTLD